MTKLFFGCQIALEKDKYKITYPLFFYDKFVKTGVPYYQ